MLKDLSNHLRLGGTVLKQASFFVPLCYALQICWRNNQIRFYENKQKVFNINLEL